MRKNLKDLHTRIHQKAYDRLSNMAIMNAISIPMVIEKLIKRATEDDSWRKASPYREYISYVLDKSCEKDAWDEGGEVGKS